MTSFYWVVQQLLLVNGVKVACQGSGLDCLKAITLFGRGHSTSTMALVGFLLCCGNLEVLVGLGISSLKGEFHGLVVSSTIGKGKEQ